MIDVEKMSHRVKLLAENAETIFLIAKDRLSSAKKNSNNFDAQQFVQLAEQMLTQFVDPFISEYIKKHVDFHSKVQVKVKTLPHFKGNIPQYESEGASGLDVRAQIGSPITIKPFQRMLVPTGLSMEIPKEYEIQARPRSGLSLKKGLTLVNTPGTIDADYRGEIKMIMINLGEEDVVIEDQERIAQLVICPVVKAEMIMADDLTDTERGAGGFGSTGSN
jgi:dUTP pyrophosphatase